MVQNPSPSFLRSDQEVGPDQLRDAEINTSVGEVDTGKKTTPECRMRSIKGTD